MPRCSIAAALATVLAFGAGLRAEPAGGEADELLAEGWRLYSEDLEFEAAAEAFDRVVGVPGATEAQRLEALEYLAACRFALDDRQGAREAVERLLRIDPEGRLHDPSHPPDLLDLVEEVREATAAAAPDQPEPPDVEAPPSLPPRSFDGGDAGGPPEGGGGGGLDQYYPDRQATPWYRTWWFWTITAAVVAAGVTTAIVLSVPAGEAEPPAGSLDPGRVQLPCVGVPF